MDYQQEDPAAKEGDIVDKNSSDAATGGITAALVVLFLYVGTAVKNSKLFFMFISTIVMAIPYIKCSIKAGLLTYAASLTLSVVLLPNKAYAFGFGFFGIYPFIKLISEKKNYKISLILKYLWFNATIFAVYFLFKDFIHLKGFFSLMEGEIILLIISEILFYFYDYIFDKFIGYIKYRLLKL